MIIRNLYTGLDELDKDIEFLNTISKFALDKAVEELKEDLRFFCFTRIKELTIEFIPSDKILVQIEEQECRLEEMLSVE